MDLSVRVVRVFTAADGSLGNPLGLLEASAATAGQEQRIATRLGYSESVFVGPVGDGVAPLRIFTPATELPFAGHPSVGTAWTLRSAGVSTLREPAGDVAVRHDGDLTWITGRAAWTPDFAFHELEDAASVDALDPASFTTGQHYVWAWLPDGRMRTRMFGPALGVPEDEATGAAAVRLTAALGRDLAIVQGSGCLLHTRFLGAADGTDRVEVGGLTVDDPQLTARAAETLLAL